MAVPNPAAMASMPSERWLVPLTRFCRKRSYARFSKVRISTIDRYIAKRVSMSISPASDRLSRVLVSPTVPSARGSAARSGQ